MVEGNDEAAELCLRRQGRLRVGVCDVFPKYKADDILIETLADSLSVNIGSEAPFVVFVGNFLYYIFFFVFHHKKKFKIAIAKIGKKL